MAEVTLGLSMRERFDSDEFSISSVAYECRHGKHYEVELLHKACGRRQVLAHDHNYREHWRHMYEASERLILASDFDADLDEPNSRLSDGSGR